ncbi:Protein phosphatase 2C (PP2C)-like domain [Macleaya cordata]|uniref:Protein phosphatase n=1 Tax=Macleaya cordata TaxID=56857 RepID=A0A200Q265_MACCD|nr:Protein phosphatase 2C (PP2C)-like domain [Macleaya cordata]
MQSYFSRLNVALRSESGRQVAGGQGLRNTVEALLGRGKLLLGNSGLSLSLPFSTLGDVNLFLRAGTVFALRSDPLVVNQPRNISFVGALSRTFSTPSVSGPSFQVCEYHIDRLVSNSTQLSPGSLFQKTPMAACGSKVVLRDHSLHNLTLKKGLLSDSKNQACFSYRRKSLDSCRTASMSLRNREPSNSNHIYGYFLFDVTRRSCNSNPFLGPENKGFHGSSSACYSAGAAPDVSIDGSAREEQLASSAATSDQKILSERTLKLLSGSCYLPHPDKEETGGEDAHFICVDEQAIGVADGVGGWADLGVDAGQYARELMSNSVSAIQEEPKGSIDPARVLEKAHSSTKAKGSSTACIIALTEQGINAINLGDSGFVVVRDGCTVFRSPVQQHDFNFTFQLESGNDGDLPSSGQVFTIPVAPGDVIVAGTDGLFDNLYNNEVTAVVVHAVRAGFGPQVMAQKIAALARQRAQDRDRQTPFSTAAQDAGFRYYGGKLDDITVVVSYITSSNV